MVENIKVIKRDGRVKSFDKNRIITAIDKAYDEVYEENSINRFSRLIADTIHNNLIQLNKESIHIEEIQNIVIIELSKWDSKVANSYKRYREIRNEERIRNSNKEKYYTGILKCTNVDNDNANVNQYSFSGRKYRIADTEQKEYALRNLISDDVAQAHRDGLIYVHDLSSYAIGEHNCLFANLEKLLNEGFSTRNCDVRPANSLSTAMQLVAVIFQCQSQEQFGGVASNAIDYQLAPFVKKSFIKHFKDGLEEHNEGTYIENDDIYIDNKELERKFPKAYKYAIKHLEKEGKQSTQALYHNLGTLESRPGRF